MQPLDRRSSVRAAPGRGREFMDEWFVRYGLLCPVFPASRLSWGLRPDDRQVHAADLQFPGRHFLSPVHGALSVHLPVLCLGQE